MKIFDKFSDSSGAICPICGTNEIKKTVLCVIDGTSDGEICEAKQFHLDCIKLRYRAGIGLLYQCFGDGTQWVDLE